MRIIYLGTPEFSVEPLKRIVEKGNHQVVGVVCNRDKAVGRKRILTPPPVKVYATQMGIPVFQYDKIRLEGVEDIKNLAPDLMITCAFGQILSKEILDIPSMGVINIHASLLPKYRGASPIHYAILNGETNTGITIMKTDVGIDTGDVMFSESVVIEDNDTCGELFNKLSILGADSIEKALYLLENGKALYTPQDDNMASYTKIITKQDALINWNKSSRQIFNHVRAFNPSPVAYTYLNGEPFKIFECEECNGVGKPGEVLCSDYQLIVACKEGAVKLKVVQKAGGKMLSISDFLLGNKIEKGMIF